MNKSELSSRVAAETPLAGSKAAAAVNALFSAITDALARGDTVTLAGFGAFTVRSREARQGRNPKTGESITIAASKAPAFKAGKTFRDALR